MTTVKRQTPDAGVSSISAPAAADRAALAREHAALFPARLALARLGSAAGLPHLHDAAGAHAPLRAAWLAQAQREFQAWLENGGFLQHEELAEVSSGDDPPAPTTDTQADNACID